MRECARCKQLKSEEEFNFKNKSKGIKQYECKNCSRHYLRSHYAKNRKYYLDKAYKRNLRIRKEIRSYVWLYLSKNPCVDCGEADPVVLEFDHIADKTENVSMMNRNYNLSKVKSEIEKCKVRCANCHRRKTALELGWNKEFLAPIA